MKSLRCTLSALVILFLVSQSAFAQSKAQTTQKPFHFKRYALQYSVTDFLKFAGYEGSMFSVKYHFNDHSAVRIGLSTSLGMRKDDGDYRRSADSLAANNTYDRRGYSFVLSIPYLYYLHPQKTIKFYSGIGPRISYTYSYTKIRQNTTVQSGSNSNRNIIRKNTSYQLGVRALTGVEWFFHSNMSLNLEYGAILEYTHNKETDNEDKVLNATKNTAQSTSKHFNWVFSPKTIYLGLTIYL